ncbi:alpha-amylase family protein [Brachybacterium sp.]|uniref:alpha-amylase family protein n=1 Tax=Brachybacterium sp. TaxID=1891286 RepID=UPI002ED40395
MKRATVGTAMRWGQLTMAENDPDPGSGFDVDFWLDYLRRCKVDGVCISAGGYVAYYPTDVPFHHRSRWLQGRDVFGELVDGARRAGMAVLARVDPHVVRADVAVQHPEWIARDPEGELRHHWVVPDLYLTCPFGGYSTEVVPQIMHEIVGTYDVDGIFANRWTGHGVSYSTAAQALFREASGRDLPVDGDGIEHWRQYERWRGSALLDLAENWDASLRRSNAATRFYPNSGGGPLSDLDMERMVSDLPGFFMDRQAREGATPIWMNGQHAKEFRAALGDRALGAIFSIGFEAPYRWKDSVQSPAELQLWIAAAIANGARPWFTKFGGTIRDGRWLDVVEEMYRWHAEAEPYLQDATSIARVAVVSSERTKHVVDAGEAHQRAQSPVLGWAQALVEARIPFDMVHADQINQAMLERYQVLIMPNVPVVTARVATDIEAWVRQGGGLVATQETGLRDESGQLLDEARFEEILGTVRLGEFTDIVRNSYLALEADHEVRGRVRDTDRIINGVRWLPIAVRPDSGGRCTSVVARLLPPFPDLPMEDMFPRDEQPGAPQILASHVGEGRTVYIAGDIDRIFDEVANPDLGGMMVGSLEWVADEWPSPVIVDAPGLLEVTVWSHGNGFAVHLVNHSNPMAMRGPARELMPHPGATVTMDCPARPAAVQLLRPRREPTWSWDSGSLVVHVDAIGDIDIIAVDLSLSADGDEDMLVEAAPL